MTRQIAAAVCLVAVAAAQIPAWDGAYLLMFIRTVPFPLAALAFGLHRTGYGWLVFVLALGVKGAMVYAAWDDGTQQQALLYPVLILLALIELLLFSLVD